MIGRASSELRAKVRDAASLPPGRPDDGGLEQDAGLLAVADGSDFECVVAMSVGRTVRSGWVVRSLPCRPNP
jgi:hypothetical protein